MLRRSWRFATTSISGLLESHVAVADPKRRNSLYRGLCRCSWRMHRNATAHRPDLSGTVHAIHYNTRDDLIGSRKNRRLGPDVLRSLRRNALTAKVPIVVLSSLPQTNEPQHKKEGAIAYFDKSKTWPRSVLGIPASHCEGIC